MYIKAALHAPKIREPEATVMVKTTKEQDAQLSQQPTALVVLIQTEALKAIHSNNVPETLNQELNQLPEAIIQDKHRL